MLPPHCAATTLLEIDMSWLSPDDQEQLISAESMFPSPIPVASVSSDAFMPAPQSPRQREFEARVKQVGVELSKPPRPRWPTNEPSR